LNGCGGKFLLGLGKHKQDISFAKSNKEKARLIRMTFAYRSTSYFFNGAEIYCRK